MKTLQGVHGALRSGHPYPVLTFLAPATLHVALRPAPRCRWLRAQHLHSAFSRCLAASTPGLQAPAEAVQPADPPATQADNRGYEPRRSDEDISKPNELEADILQSFLNTDLGDKKLREKATDYWGRKSKSMHRNDYTSTHRRRPDDASSKNAVRNVEAIIGKLRKPGRFAPERETSGSASGSTAADSLEVAPRPGDPDATAIKYQAPEVDLRINPYLGRSVPVNPDHGLAAALRGLNRKLRVNNVRQDLIKQRFHERPGLKRKRLKRERWRKRFKEGFKAMIAQVQEMHRKGW